MVFALAGDSTMTSLGRVSRLPFVSVVASGSDTRLLFVELLDQLVGQAGSGTPVGGSPTSSRSRDSRRRPTMRYAGPSPRGPTKVPGTPAAARAAPTSGHPCSSEAPSPSVYPSPRPAGSPRPAPSAHQRSRGPSSCSPEGG